MEAFGLEMEKALGLSLSRPTECLAPTLLARVFGRLDPREPPKCLAGRLECGPPGRSAVAIGGKTMLGGGASCGHARLSQESRLAPGEIAVPEKAGETTAIPEPLGLIDVEGNIAAIGALARWKAIAEKIVGKKAG